MIETLQPKVHYPSGDGKPMAENTLQYEWIATLKWNLEVLLHDRPDAFVAGDHLIYPVEGDPTIRQAPDTYVAFGVPKGHRGSYKVFEENGIFPQVIFEVWSPSNTVAAMDEIREHFYEYYGAEEFYILYPDFPVAVDIWHRVDDRLQKVSNPSTWMSPRLGIRFKIGKGSVSVLGPDGKVFRNPLEIALARNEVESALKIIERELHETELERDAVKNERDTVRSERDAVKNERDAVRSERDAAKSERDAAQRERDEERERVSQLMAKLRQLGIDPTEIV